MSRLHAAGMSLLPLGGGSDGKAPLRGLSATQRLSLKQVLGPMHRKGSSCYGVRLDGLAVIDCDDYDPDLIKKMEARFGASPVHVATPRGVHLYYRHSWGQVPNLRGEGLPVDIKRGASSYVVGPHSIRTDGGRYEPIKGLLDNYGLPLIAAAETKVRYRSGAITTGSRNNELCLAAINQVETIETPDELFSNLAFIRDEECENPSTIPDEELRKIADWAWSKRLEGNVYRDRNSEFRMNRACLARLADFDNVSDAVALLVILQANHGHQPGKTFTIDYPGMLHAGHTSLSRRRFINARRTLQTAGLLGVAKEYSVGHSRRSYRLLRIRPDLPNVHSIFTAQEASS